MHLFYRVLGLSLLFFSNNLYSWDNYFRFINNFKTPMTITFKPETGWYHDAYVYNLCGGSIENVKVAANSISCEFQLTDGEMNWYSSYDSNKGEIIIAKADDPNAFCQFHYYYSRENWDSYFKAHSEEITLVRCQGGLQSNMFSVVNPRVKALPRPIVGDVILNAYLMKPAELTESLSFSDCSGKSGDNCIIFSPDLETNYIQNGSTLKEALNIQAHINQSEPLNFEQFIGGHNSAISRHYTSSTSEYNLSYSDPDAYSSLTDQLNWGVRQIELDIQWFNNTITVCHNRVTDNELSKKVLCDGDYSLSGNNETFPLNEIADWANNHPNEFIIIYFDVNQPLDDHIEQLDQIIAETLNWKSGDNQGQSMVFTPNDALTYYGTKSLPAYQLNAKELINRFHKNIILTNDDGNPNGGPNLSQSQYIFTQASKTDTTPLYHKSANDFSIKNVQCTNNVNKYQIINQLYSKDSNHYNLFRVNGDRTTFNYISSADSGKPHDYQDYITTTNLTNMLACPLNVFALNMLGFTCDSTNCKNHPTDPRLYRFLWSWAIGYPLKDSGLNIAYINPNTNHFENEQLPLNQNYQVLCLKSNTTLESPITQLNWYTKSIELTSNNIYPTAQKTCQASGGIFAAPVTSYWMDDVIHFMSDNAIKTPVIINYQYLNGLWIANDSQSLIYNTSNAKIIFDNNNTIR